MPNSKGRGRFARRRGGCCQRENLKGELSLLIKKLFLFELVSNAFRPRELVNAHEGLHPLLFVQRIHYAEPFFIQDFQELRSPPVWLPVCRAHQEIHVSFILSTLFLSPPPLPPFSPVIIFRMKSPPNVQVVP